ncbi:MAG: hypothetical protein HOW71_37920 [Nonomuraea sp.]|nr:hypothetical protein [Nonomuraea sp.]NUS01279.1 hypothetical protein [Nonomuraea sp.]
MRGRPGGPVLLMSGPVLVGAYAAVNYAAIRAASGAQRSGSGRVTPDGLTSLGVDVWWVVKGVTLVVGFAALTVAVVGLLLRRRGRGRSFLLVLAGVPIVPYALGIAVAFANPVPWMATFYRSPDFAAALPSWQPASALILLAAALAQAAGALWRRRPAEP